MEENEQVIEAEEGTEILDLGVEYPEDELVEE